MFLCDVACQKLLNSANVSQSYSQNNTGTVFVETRCIIYVHVCDLCIMLNNSMLIVNVCKWCQLFVILNVCVCDCW